MKVELRLFFDKQQKIFEEHLQKVKVSDDAELIHQMRLSVKRIRALFTFLQFLTEKPKKGKKDIKALKVVYKPAGRIRDVQVHLELLDTYEKRLQFEFTNYRSYLEKLEKQHHKDLKESLTDFNTEPIERLHKKTADTLDKFSDKEIMKSAGKMLDTKLELISNLNKIPTEKEKNLHEIRRILKEIRYLLNIFNGNIPESKRLKVSLTRLKQIEQTLGKWHDQVNASLFVKAYLNSKQIEDKAQKEKYKLLLKAIRRYKSSLLKRIQHAFKYELEV